MTDHAPVAIYALDDFPDWAFVRCACGQDPVFDVWLRRHWTGSEEDGKAACRAVMSA